MPTFPVLKCGASLQHPAERVVKYETHVTRFLDGSEQRFRARGTAAKRWTSSLTMLDESESRQIEALFRERQGEFGEFRSPTPGMGRRIRNAGLPKVGWNGARTMRRGSV